MFSREACLCVSCGISTSSQSIKNSKLSSSFAAKLAQDPRSRWHGTTVVASLSPASRGNKSARAAEGKLCLRNPSPPVTPPGEAGFSATSPLRNATASDGQASPQPTGRFLLMHRVLCVVRSFRLEIHFGDWLGSCGPVGSWHSPDQMEAIWV